MPIQKIAPDAITLRISGEEREMFIYLFNRDVGGVEVTDSPWMQEQWDALCDRVYAEMVD